MSSITIKDTLLRAGAGLLSFCALGAGAAGQCETDVVDGPWLRFGADVDVDVDVEGSRFLVVSDDFFLAVASVMERVGGVWTETTLEFGHGPILGAGANLTNLYSVTFSP